MAILRHSWASSWKTRPQAIPFEDIMGPKKNPSLVIRRASLGEDSWAILPFCFEVRAKVSGKSNLCVFEVVVLCSFAVLPASYFD